MVKASRFQRSNHEFHEADRSVLRAESLNLGYGPLSVIRDLDLAIYPGELVALFGPNGAGKTTTLLGLANWLKPTNGNIYWLGALDKSPPHRRARAGLAYIPEGSTVIPNLSVRDNLRIGSAEMEQVFENAPELRELLDRKAGLLSGGEKQILALGRAIATQPRLILVDELSLGLAPLVVTRLFGALKVAAERGAAVLVVEQHIEIALKFIDRGYVMVRGQLTMRGTAEELKRNRTELEAAYLSNAGREDS